MLRERAERDAGAALSSVVLGRPVRFVDDDAGRDADAQATLAACARAAGFREIEFQLEPIAAAFDYERLLAREEAVLVVDVGGGTADFTVIRVGPGRRERADRIADVLANDGIHIAGTDFDTRLHLAWVMPALGYGSTSRKGLAMPSPLFFDLSTWHRINLLYGPATREALRELHEFFVDARMYARLRKVVHDAPGARAPRAHGNREDRAVARHARDDRPAHVEAGLAADVAREELQALLARAPRASRHDGHRYRARRRPRAGCRLDRLLHGRIERHDGLARGVRAGVSPQPDGGRRPFRQRGQRPRHRRARERLRANASSRPPRRAPRSRARGA